jgi:hypothetical protein
MEIINLFGTDSLYQTDISAIADSTYRSLINTYFNWGSFFTGAVVFVAVSVLMCFIMNVAGGRRTWKFVLVMIPVAFLIRALSVYLWNIEPESDFAITYELSRLLAQTDISQWGEALDGYGTIYNTIWSAHMPFVIYQSLIIRFLGSSKEVLGLVNAMWGTLSCLAASGIALKLFGKNAACNTLMFMAFNPVCIFFTPVLSNQHPAVFFLLLGILIVCCVPQWWLRGILSGIVFAIGQLIRPEITATVAAVAVYFLYEGIKERRKFYSIVCCVILMLSFFGAAATADKLLSDNKIIHGSILEQNMKYKIAVGLDKETQGSWSAENEALIYDEEKLDTVFKDRLKNLSPIMMAQKTVYQFGTYVYPASMKSEKPILSSILVRRASTAMMGMITVFACLTMIFDNEKRRKIMPLVIILGTYMAIYSVIEIQARYNFLMLPVITILGSDMVLEKGRKKHAAGMR